MADPETPDKPPFQEYYFHPNGVLARIDADGSFHEIPLDPVPLPEVQPESAETRDDDAD